MRAGSLLARDRRQIEPPTVLSTLLTWFAEEQQGDDGDDGDQGEDECVLGKALAFVVPSQPSEDHLEHVRVPSVCVGR